MSASNGNEVKNEVSKWLLERLVTAAQHRQMFRLIIVIPLHPEGDYLNDRAVQVVMHYQYQTICRYAPRATKNQLHVRKLGSDMGFG